MLEINEDKTVRAFSAQYFSFVQHHQYHHSGITSFYRRGTQDPLNCEKNRYITLGLSKWSLEISPFSQSSPSISTEQGGSNSGKIRIHPKGLVKIRKIVPLVWESRDRRVWIPGRKKANTGKKQKEFVSNFFNHWSVEMGRWHIIKNTSIMLRNTLELPPAFVFFCILEFPTLQSLNFFCILLYLPHTDTVDGSEIRLTSLVNIPWLTWFLYIPGGDRRISEASTVY